MRETPHTLTARNVNYALTESLWRLKSAGVEESSRNGPVLLLPSPITIAYLEPQERVLFSKERDANPFFHFMEGLWMLAGRNDVAWLQQFNSRMGEFSDDKMSLWGAYGWRWRSFFDGRDQLKRIIAHLRETPHSRRAVLTMWAPDGDLWPSFHPGDVEETQPLGGLGSRDIPCNTNAYLAIHDGKLNLTVMNRSNDAIWGAFGTNAVHMSMLQEYIAMHLGIPMGTYYQFTNNLHVYTERFPEEVRERLMLDLDDRYVSKVAAQPFLQQEETPEGWDADLQTFFVNSEASPPFFGPGLWNTVFFADTVMPMYWAWMHRKSKRSIGLADAQEIAAPDWRMACVEWIERREGTNGRGRA